MRLFQSILFLSMIGLMLSLQATSQTTKTGKALSDLKKLADGLKIKKAPKDTTKKVGEAESTHVLSATWNGLKPGDIAPDVKYIDASLLRPFSGAAIIEKGSSTALIDSSGTLLAPYNKYKFNPYGNGGLFEASGPGDGSISTDHYLINFKGETVFRGIFTIQGPGLAVIRPRETIKVPDLVVLIDVEGHKYNFKVPDNRKFLEVRDRIITLSKEYSGIGNNPNNLANTSTLPYEYARLNGQLLTKQTFSEINPFHDGMAIVGSRNEFSEMKYGFVNDKGEMPIPLQYTAMPTPFVNGFAKVTPKQNGEFLFAFINKKGEIKIKVTKEMSAQLGMTGGANLSPNFLRCGIAYKDRSKYALDTTGKIIFLKDFIDGNNANRVAIQSDQIELLQRKDNGGLDYPDYYYFPCIRMNKEKKPRFISLAYGFVNTDKKIIIPPIFEHPLDFDPITKLAPAKLFLSPGAGGPETDTYREGYINEYGVFVIVKKSEDSTF